MNLPATYSFWTSEEGVTRIAAWARQGLTNAQLIQKIGVTPRTFAHWRRQCPRIAEALRQGREYVNTLVENALLKRALGYTAVETCEEDTPSGPKVKTSEKHVPPDVSAQLYWLKTHCPEVWGEKKEARSAGAVPEIIEAVRMID